MTQSISKADPLARASVLEALQLLISTPSVNPDLAPGEGLGEAAIANVIREWFTNRGIDCALEEAAPGRPNAVARIGSSSGPTLVFCAHIDTVSTAGMTIAPFDPRVEGNRVYGRGSNDMKGGAAAILCAMAKLAQEPLAGTILSALVADEEYASIGAQHFVAHHKGDACIVTEPSEGRLILGHKGFVWAEITTEGRAAHGSRWDLGVSAISRMGRIITALDEFDRTQLRARTHPLVGPASQHCATVRGGAGLSTYAPSCTLEIERRTIPGETPAQVLDELRSVIASTGEQAAVRLLLDRPPLVCPRDARIAQCARDAATALHGHAPEESGVAYWMDAALFAAAGIQTVNYGASGAGDHEAVEYADLDSVVDCAQVLTATARLFLAK
ncbi:MAG TPA: M20/M25/M40 family metallo-hydrolase [Candidatus Limnocylindrales bacterium]|nr:M20/M25/M40 family metallo-hydrolase [Candidatus Limnocylindrales bacterium]